MTTHLLRLAGAAVAALASQVLPVGAQERPSMVLVLIGPKDDNSWAEAAHRALEAEAAKGSRTAFAEFGRRCVRRAGDARLCRPGICDGRAQLQLPEQYVTEPSNDKKKKKKCIVIVASTNELQFALLVTSRS